MLVSYTSTAESLMALITEAAVLDHEKSLTVLFLGTVKQANFARARIVSTRHDALRETLFARVRVARSLSLKKISRIANSRYIIYTVAVALYSLFE